MQTLILDKHIRSFREQEFGYVIVNKYFGSYDL